MLFLTARVDHTAEQIFKIEQLRQLVESKLNAVCEFLDSISQMKLFQNART